MPASSVTCFVCFVCFVCLRESFSCSLKKAIHELHELHEQNLNAYPVSAMPSSSL